MRIFIIASFVLLALSPWAALSEEQPGLEPGPAFPALEQAKFLPVDEAFQLTATRDGQVVVLRWQLMPGYYLYRHRLSFAAQGGELGAPQMGPGKAMWDEYFGDIEVYYDELSVTLPIVEEVEGQALDLMVEYQGCADAGLCYPPQKRTISAENM